MHDSLAETILEVIGGRLSRFGFRSSRFYHDPNSCDGGYIDLRIA